MAHKFGDEVRDLIRDVGSVQRMLPPFASAAGMMTQKVEGDLKKLIDLHGTDKQLNSEGQVTQFALPKEYSKRYRKIRRSYDDSRIFMTLLPRMSLVSLVSLYDAYFGRLVKGMFEAKPEILNGSNRQLTFAQIIEFGTMEAAKQHLIEQEVESLLRESHTAHFDWLESKLGIPLRKDLAVWPVFVEVTERRNLFVHADSIVGSQYINVCKKAGVNLDQDCLAGKKLNVLPDYFRTACEAICEIGIKLNQVMWRKLLPSDAHAADNSLIEVAFDLLMQREYKLAEVILRFGTSPPFKHASAENTLYLKVNLAIALKAQDKKDECSRLIDSIDWSALSDLFQLAAAALREEAETAAILVRRIGKSEKPGMLAYRDWPLFQWLRKSDHFRDAFQDVFGEPLGVIKPPRDAKEDPPAPDQNHQVLESPSDKAVH